MILWGDNIGVVNGYCLYRLRLAVRPNIILGGNGNY